MAEEVSWWGLRSGVDVQPSLDPSLTENPFTDVQPFERGALLPSSVERRGCLVAACPRRG